MNKNETMTVEQVQALTEQVQKLGNQFMVAPGFSPKERAARRQRIRARHLKRMQFHMDDILQKRSWIPSAIGLAELERSAGLTFELSKLMNVVRGFHAKIEDMFLEVGPSAASSATAAHAHVKLGIKRASQELEDEKAPRRRKARRSKARPAKEQVADESRALKVLPALEKRIA